MSKKLKSKKTPDSNKDNNYKSSQRSRDKINDIKRIEVRVHKDDEAAVKTYALNKAKKRGITIAKK